MDLRESRTRGGVRHPWETARASFLLALLERHGRLEARDALDIGAGDAYFASRLVGRLSAGAAVVCVDSNYDAETLAGLSLPNGITASATLPTGRFELLLALDVAEHVEDDRGFASALRARVTADGALLFTVPAWPSLFSDHDRALLHFRRYTHASARALLRSAGFRILEDGGFFHALVAPRLAALALEKLGRRPGPDANTAWNGSERSAKAIASLLEAEHAVTHALGRRGWSLPGLSYYALAVPA